jgi:hypothetical protein
MVLCGAMAIGVAGISLAQKYSGPKPPKADVPYLLHASNLIETEVSEAQQGSGKDEGAYTIRGASSPARTPLAEPIFILRADKLNPDRLSLFRMEVKNGQRQVALASPGKRSRSGAKPIFMMVHRLNNGLFRVEVNEYLENGEYCMSPDGSNQVFCFETY